MKPTRALGTRDRTPSSIPIPARSTGQTATFLPAMRCAVIFSSGVSISASPCRHVLRRLVGEEQRDLLGELAEVDGRRVLVAEVAELVLDERVLDHREARRRSRDVRRVAAEAGIQRAPGEEVRDTGANAVDVGRVGQRLNR